jgi:hypothetical protein
MSTKKNSNKSSWGGARENAGRKSTWNNQETCTMRIPKVFARRLYETAQKWDKQEDIEKETYSKSSEFETVTESISDSIIPLSAAIDLAKDILCQRKSARISLAKFLSKLYSTTVKSEDLN